MQPIIQALIITILPILGSVLPGILKKDSYPPQANALIAAVVVVAASAGTAYAKDQLGPSFVEDLFIVMVGISAILAGPLKGLDEFLQARVNASPASGDGTNIPLSPNPEPQPIILPNNRGGQGSI